jgi:hypothetical protein
MRSIEEPLRQTVANAGEDAAVVLAEAPKDEEHKHGGMQAMGEIGM